MSLDPGARETTAPAQSGPGSPAHERERLARAALIRICEPGHPRATATVAELGGAQTYELLLQGHPLGGLWESVQGRLAEVDPIHELESAHRLDARLVIPGDPEWPAGVDDLAESGVLNARGGVPIGLWVRGPLRLDRLTRAVAVVGSRTTTTYGVETAGLLAAGIAGAGHPVVSGAAFGIDQAAHRGALGAAGQTAAVLACGVDRAYPEAHARLLDHLRHHGAVISEAPLGAAPTKVRFLARNRLIAAVTAGTVVVEAAVRSGALNTANWAAALHRHLMAVPGPVTSATSQGTHQLIRSGKAALITAPEEVLELVSATGEQTLRPPRGPDTLWDSLSDTAREVLDALSYTVAYDTAGVARRAGLTTRETERSLGLLEAQQLARRGSGGWVLGPRSAAD